MVERDNKDPFLRVAFDTAILTVISLSLLGFIGFIMLSAYQEHQTAESRTYDVDRATFVRADETQDSAFYIQFDIDGGTYLYDEQNITYVLSDKPEDYRMVTEAGNTIRFYVGEDRQDGLERAYQNKLKSRLPWSDNET